MSSIPLDNIVKINPGVLEVGNNPNNLFGLLLTENIAVSSETVETYKTLKQVKEKFTDNSIEYRLAEIYFSGFTNSDKVSAQLYMASYSASTTVATVLNSASLSDVTVDQLKKFRGSLNITIDKTNIALIDVDFSPVNSFSDAATILSDELTAGYGQGQTINVTYSAIDNRFIIDTKNIGENVRIKKVSGNLAISLRLTPEQGGYVSGANGNEIGIFNTLNRLREDNLAFCSVFFTKELGYDDKLDAARWANSMKDDVCVILSDSDSQAIETGKQNTFSEQITAQGYEGVISVYNYIELCAFIAGYPGAWDLDKTDGRYTAAFRRSSLLKPNVTNEKEALALQEKGYNFYGQWASATNNFTFMYDGRISGQYLWIDSWYCQVWMRRLFQYYFILTLLAKGQIPYNNDGKGILQTAIKPAIDQFKKFGAIRDGVSLSDVQIQGLKQVGLNQSQISNITSMGYYLNVNMAAVSAVTRVQRGSPPIDFWYTDGQSVQKINMNSIEIQ